ncbi:MAG: Bacterial domain [Ferruginibacter sp.]|nr:Bacterial domain [Ferruginibacter sp.]
MDKLFKSKIDQSTIIRYFLLIIALGIYLYQLHLRATSINTLITGYVLGMIILIPFGVILPLKTTYKITGEGVLIIPAGIRMIRINIPEISSIEITRSWTEFVFSSYVNSLDQIKLSYNNSTIIISPDDAEVFTRTLQNINPAINAASSKI